MQSTSKTTVGKYGKFSSRNAEHYAHRTFSETSYDMNAASEYYLLNIHATTLHHTSSDCKI